MKNQKIGGGRKGRKPGEWVALSHGRNGGAPRLPVRMYAATSMCEHGSYFSVCRAGHPR